MIFTVLAYTVISIWLHELGHAAASVLTGDTLGSRRWTIRPFVNLDPFLSILAPLVTSLLSGGLFAWGMGRPFLLERSSARVLIAGPAVNVLLVSLGLLAGNTVLWRINAVLAIYNLIPVPPLDGWGIVHALREAKLRREVRRERMKLVR